MDFIFPGSGTDAFRHFRSKEYDAVRTRQRPILAPKSALQIPFQDDSIKTSIPSEAWESAVLQQAAGLHDRTAKNAEKVAATAQAPLHISRSSFRRKAQRRPRGENVRGRQVCGLPKINSSN